MVTTDETAANTIEPTAVALQSANTSSITNKTPLMGVLNAAAIPAAAPTGAIRRMLFRGRLNNLPSHDATPAPICRDGSSGPNELPVPIAMPHPRNLPRMVLDETYPSEL